MKTILALCAMLLFSPTISFANDYHVLTQRKNARTVDVVFHIPIPDDINAADYSLRSAVSELIGTSTFTSQVPWLTGQEVTDLQNGILFEQMETVKFLATDDDTQKQTKIENRFTVTSTNIVDKLKTILKFWQFNSDVP